MLALLLSMLVAVPVAAQVIEIAGDGTTTTYDRPMIFTAASASPVEKVAHRPVAIALPASIGEAARVHGLDPGLLEAVAWQESRGRMSALSPKGAIGTMQLMPATAASLGVDPYDPADNLRGGALYLRRQIERFGSVELGLAAYNAGPGAVLRHRGIPPYRETRSYVTNILARWQRAASPPAPPSNPVAIEVPNL